MSPWRSLKRWQTGSRKKKKKKYAYHLGDFLKLIPIDTKDRGRSKDEQGISDSNDLSGDPNTDERYRMWIGLSPREQDVTAFTCLRYTNPQIAARLGLSVTTVRTYLDKVLSKLGLQTKADVRVFFASWDFSAFEGSDPPR